MKKLITIIICITIFIILIFACEKRKDPFSALNKAPSIEAFSFEDDSLKFTKVEPYDISYITLKYLDAEDQDLTATFTFLSGGGTIFHSLFQEKSSTENSIIFDIPSEFDSDEDGKLSFIPDTTGLVELELEISDKIKMTNETRITYFYKNLGPIAKLKEPQKLSAVSPYLIEFDASESKDSDEGTIIWYYWDFGDGETESVKDDPKIQHSYLTSGTYTVKLKVEDDEGAVDSTEKVVNTTNQHPIADLQVDPTFGEAPLTINFTATNSRDFDGQILTYYISFDDGQSSSDSVGTHEYKSDNDYNVELTVTDNLDVSNTNTAIVTVSVATPPVAVLKITPTEGPFPLDCIIDGTGSYDPQEGKLDHDIYINNQLVYDNIDKITHTFDVPEDYLIRLVVTSQRNSLTDAEHQSVTVDNINPNADFTWEPEFPQHQTPVTYTSTSIDSNTTDAISYYKWTFPDAEIEGEDKATIIHSFNAGFDPYRVKLEVWDKYKGTKFEGSDSIEKIITEGK